MNTNQGNKNPYVQIIAMSDLHAEGFKASQARDGDMVLLAGDICPSGRRDERGVRHWGGYSSKLEWLEKAFFEQCRQFPGKIVLTLGNRDTFIREKPLDEIKWPSNVICLVDEMKEVNGIKIYGCPWVSIKNHLLKAGRSGRGVFELTPEELKKKYDAIPEGVDILLSHATPANTDTEIDVGIEKMEDGTRRPARFGSEPLADAIERAKPKLVVCGHVHAKSHRLAHLRRNNEIKVANVSLAVCGHRKEADRGHQPTYIWAIVIPAFGPKLCPSLFVEDRSDNSVKIDPYFTQTGDPSDPVSGNPFEKDSYAAKFWELEARLLNPKTVNFDEVARVGTQCLESGTCSKSISGSDWPEGVKVLAAAMEAKGVELECKCPKGPVFSDLPWERFFDELPEVRPPRCRYYHGERDCPFKNGEGYRDGEYWASERMVVNGTWPSSSSEEYLDDKKHYYKFMVADRPPLFRQVNAPLIEQVMGWYAVQKIRKWCQPFSVDDAQALSYFAGPKPKMVRITCTFKLKPNKK